MAMNRQQNKKNDIQPRIILSVIAVLFAFVVIAGLLYFQGETLDYKAIQDIYALQTGPNEFNDIGDSIGIHSMNDIGYMVKSNGNITLYYGKKTLKIPKRSLADQDYMNALAKIGIEVRMHEVSGNEVPMYKVTYWGHELLQWVERNSV